MAPKPNPNPDPAPEPEPTPPAPTPGEPDWMGELRSIRDEIRQIPGKLKATISDDDRRTIAEQVHGLFEKSGAFIKPDPAPDPEPGDPEPEPEPTDPGPEQKTIAERLGFPKW